MNNMNIIDNIAIKSIPVNHANTAIREIACLNYLCSYRSINGSVLGQEFIVPFLGATIDGEMIKIKMVAYDCSLHDLINKHIATKTQIDIYLVKRWALQIATGLDYINRAGIMHADIKPGNILVKGNDIAICDFGLAVIDREKIHSNIIQSDCYRAPEVYHSSNPILEPNLDTWGLGMIIFQMLCGRRLMMDPNISTIDFMCNFLGIRCIAEEKIEKLADVSMDQMVAALTREIALYRADKPTDIIKIMAQCLYPSQSLRLYVYGARKQLGDLHGIIWTPIIIPRMIQKKHVTGSTIFDTEPNRHLGCACENIAREIYNRYTSIYTKTPTKAREASLYIGQSLHRGCKNYLRYVSKEVIIMAFEMMQSMNWNPVG